MNVSKADACVDTMDLLSTFASLKRRQLDEYRRNSASESVVQVEQTGSNGYDPAVHWADPLCFKSKKRKEYSDIESRVAKFIGLQRERIDQSNISEFLDRAQQGSDDSFSARTSAATINRKVQMKQSVADNQDGPLLNTMRSHWSNINSEPTGDSDAPGISARLDHLERHLDIHYAPCAIPVTVYDRLKLLESKITLLEATLPAWADQYFSSLDDEKARKWKEKVQSLDRASDLAQQVAQVHDWPEPPRTIFTKLSHVRFSESVSHGSVKPSGDANVIYLPKKDRITISGQSTPNASAPSSPAHLAGPEQPPAADQTSKESLLHELNGEIATLQEIILKKYS